MSALLTTLQSRFEAHPHRHPDISWQSVAARLQQSPEKLAILERMEATGGEPDVIQMDAHADEVVFFDCASESPRGRRSLCYDEAAWQSRKTNRPEGTVQEMVREMGVILLDETQYRYLQDIEPCDQKTSSWIQTPQEIRSLGGALFCDRRYSHVFTYHNGADSYYAGRGWRGYIIV